MSKFIKLLFGTLIGLMMLTSFTSVAIPEGFIVLLAMATLGFIAIGLILTIIYPTKKEN
jgi:hypothetical protein